MMQTVAARLSHGIFSRAGQESVVGDRKLIGLPGSKKPELVGSQ